MNNKEACQKYKKTDKGIKNVKISAWRKIGIIDTDFDSLYAFVLGETNCMICDKKYKNSLDRVVDHDHDDGSVRYICCRTCNVHVIK